MFLLACAFYARPQAKDHATMTLMLPAWVVYLGLGISSSYLYKLLESKHHNHATLARHLAHADWKTGWTDYGTGERLTRSGGTLWAVRAHPIDLGIVHL